MLRIPLLILACAAVGAAYADASAVPQVYAPGEISGLVSVDSLNFTPDGDTAIYALSSGTNNFIVVSRRRGGHWTKPEIAAFSGQWSDGDPALSPDGKFLVFVSNRPAMAGGPPAVDSGALWRVERHGDAWGAPERLPDTVNTAPWPSPPTIATPSVAADGSLYFMRHGEDKLLHIYRSQYRDGRYEPAVQQALGKASEKQKDPAVAPDESFIVFSSPGAVPSGADRLYIAFREGDHWGPAQDLGDAVNADNWPWGSHIGPDGGTLYYASTRSPPVSYPRSPEQARQDFARLKRWDNGVAHIWYVSLQPWIAAYRDCGT